ncbi:indolepyruvate ferredoxin oxidoreductase family protein [Pikeienuella piscinae]|uniref:Indolepyruvate ferredoxin oxidoreductase family protein n=1 Tax=Pikeienuella piscinae TaxID=2748098 RepID=A0A7M3T6P7_9RHOB|nr:indolepyruvate ferredoxin oxidoreductase family protein [Pikeienuella piscinae]QIE57678.1 indolepyruvate ferredoxin oxidoreductase family protein [Pikeienuella piscinae]
MKHAEVSLGDRYDLECEQVLLNGTQALVRLMLTQKWRDSQAGHNTAGYVSGYRGSPLGGVDATFLGAKKWTEPADILFEPALNEDSGATMLWGAQQAGLRGDGTHDGVFGLWYGKGPGVDRSGDVFRHASLAGTAPLGGVLAAMGDDHTGESSTTVHQSDFAFVDAHMPILAPAGVQEIIDLGVHGYALSRFASLWVGVKCLKDTIESTAVIDGRPDRVQVTIPTDFEMPEGGLSIRLGDDRIPQEVRMQRYKRWAAHAYARANGIDKRVRGKKGAKIGVVSAGKSWLDVAHALDLLGIDEETAERIGVTVYKPAMIYPLEPTALKDWAEGLELIVVVEEKRSLIESQIKELLYDLPMRPRVVGKRDEADNVLFPVEMGLNPVDVALKLGRILFDEGVASEINTRRIEALEATANSANVEATPERTPWFCAGCPHNSSTKLPDGSIGFAGIGCHFMAQWMDRGVSGYTHMGGEGVNWIGESRFSKTKHAFQQLGDGTYTHSGQQAIRSAVAANANITYKILYNDAVAMTGGQTLEGGLEVYRIIDEVKAYGVKKLVVVYDEKEGFDPSKVPAGVETRKREELDAVQRELREIEGVTALIYVQTCAAEKRRRRKRGKFPDIDKRVYINPEVCEGCGDCGVQSNCVAVAPLDTELGRKRQIDQSACNKDFSCLKGFCPSFVTLHGATVKKEKAAGLDLPDLPEPVIPEIDKVWNTVTTGVGGTGVVTIGALLGMAAHVEGKGAGVMEMAGLAQKGGAVQIHCRIAESPADITAIRVATGEADVVIGGDLLVTAGAKTLALMANGRTGVVCNTYEINTGEFTRDGGFRIPADRLRLGLEARVGDENVVYLNATRLAERLLGDAIFSNVLVLGAAWQMGRIPLAKESILKAIELNGAGVEGNKAAFEIGRWAVVHPEEAKKAVAPRQVAATTWAEKIDLRHRRLIAWGGRKWADRWLASVRAAEAAEKKIPGADGFAEAAAFGLFKLMSYKDEYEVARLHAETLESQIGERFDNVRKIEFHMAPPIFGRKDSKGQPVKSTFGPWLLPVLKRLAKLKGLRGTPLDVFGYSAERRAERAAIAEHEALLAELGANLTPETHATAVQLAALPLQVKGFGHIKAANAKAAAARRAELLAEFHSGGAPVKHAAE